MTQEEKPGQIVILNGTPRAGKSSIVKAIQETFDGPWLNLGVDAFKERIHPQRYSPGIGLRPGGEAPDLESLIPVLYAAMYESIAAHSRLGLNVVVDVGHHDWYSNPLGILPDCARRLQGLPVLFVGVRCPVEVIMQRLRQTGRWNNAWDSDISQANPVPAPLLRWQKAVHQPGIYDLEVDTSVLSPEECANVILARLQNGPASIAFQQLAQLSVNDAPA
ncbi:MAG: chloramphenicol phosphotransferase [Caldilineaceae bacterium]|nr:chloramphenicol phosphotransferase [Caldilineaceae bacterium]